MRSTPAVFRAKALGRDRSVLSAKQVPGTAAEAPAQCSWLVFSPTQQASLRTGHLLEACLLEAEAGKRRDTSSKPRRRAENPRQPIGMLGTPGTVECMAVSRPAPQDIIAAHLTQYMRFTSYQGEQCAVLVALLNEHYDITLRISARNGTRSTPAHIVTRIAQGSTDVDVAGFVAERIRAAVSAAVERGDSVRAVARVRERCGYFETRHLLEDIAFLHGVICVDRVRHTQRPENPSLAVIASETFLLTRNEIAHRGFYIHQMLGMMAGAEQEITVRRGNRFLRLMVAAPTYVAIFRLVEQMIGARRDAEHAVVVLGGPGHAVPVANGAVPDERDSPAGRTSNTGRAAVPERPRPTTTF